MYLFISTLIYLFFLFRMLVLEHILRYTKVIHPLLLVVTQTQIVQGNSSHLSQQPRKALIVAKKDCSVHVWLPSPLLLVIGFLGINNTNYCFLAFS